MDAVPYVPFELLCRRCPDILRRERVPGRSALRADGDPGLSRVIPAQFRQRMSLEQGLRQQKAAKPNYSKENKSKRED